jgi:hypothetical protein
LCEVCAAESASADCQATVEEEGVDQIYVFWTGSTVIDTYRSGHVCPSSRRIRYTISVGGAALLLYGVPR